jgi:hypothetical protein
MTQSQHGHQIMDVKVVDIVRNQDVLIVQDFRTLVLGGHLGFSTLRLTPFSSADNPLSKDSVNPIISNHSSI